MTGAFANLVADPAIEGGQVGDGATEDEVEGTS